MLRNSHSTLTALGEEVLIVGVDDGRSGHAGAARAFRSVRVPEESIVLTHDPRSVVSIAAEGGRVILAGHTHAGHVGLPRVRSAIGELMGHPFVAGHYQVGACHLYVNAGLGNRWRVGLKASPELAVIELCEPWENLDQAPVAQAGRGARGVSRGRR